MATERNTSDRRDGIISSPSTERVVRGLDGESYTLRGTNNAPSTTSDGVTGRDSTGSAEGEPEFTRPDTLSLFGFNEETGKEETKSKPRASSSKTIVGPKTTPGINAKTCGNIAAGIMDAISFLLTRTPVLGLSETEETEMGEVLFETVSNFPATSASVKFLNFLAPWAGLIHTSSKIVWKRMAFIEMHRKPKVRENKSPFPQYRDEIVAPDPSKAM